MPTGYTAYIAEGTETTLRQFALRCARGMGALVTMRDDPHDAPIPTELAPSLHHARRLIDIKAEIAQLDALTPEQLDAAAAGYFDQQHADWTERRARQAAVRDRYDALLEALDNSTVVFPDGLAALMRSQLEESRKFDCWSKEDQTRFDPEPQPMTPAEWLADKLAGLYKDVAYHTVEHQKELDRNAGRNAWLAQLHTALKGLPE